MPATNYYKATTGDMSAHGLKQAIFPFDDGDPDSHRVALRDARPWAPGEAAQVSVWRLTAEVPSYMPVVGKPRVGGMVVAEGIVDVGELMRKAG